LVTFVVVEASMYSNRIVRSWERVSCSHGAQMWRISRLLAAQVDFMAAISKQSPTEP
jgi:hypothetical protein